MRKFWQRPTRGIVCSYNSQDEDPICNLITPGFSRVSQRHESTSRFNGFAADDNR